MKAARIGKVGVILAPAVDRTLFPVDVRAGIGAADKPDVAWREARTALRLTTAREPVLEQAESGALALLAELPREVLRGNPGVASLVRMAGDPGNPWEESRETLDTLEAYCAAGSLRRAADVLHLHLHLHHSSVARRIDLISRALSVDLTTPMGLTRARVALTAWRLLGDHRG